VKQVYVARNEVEARLVCQMLAKEDILAVVRADPVPITAQPFPCVYVAHEPDVARAEELVREYVAD